ncbi:MAG: hypothetical protein R2834_16890 [Rhodothermales bacterium]
MKVRADEGSAFAWVLALMAILSVLVGTVMAVHVAQRRFVGRDVLRAQARYLAESCLHRALASLAVDPGWRADSLAFDDDAHRGCRLFASLLGGYVQVRVAARAGTARHHIDALVGFRPPDAFRFAILLGDPSSPLQLAGETVVRGDIRVGVPGINLAVFEGRPFSGKVDGETARMAAPVLPSLESGWAEILRDSLRERIASAARGRRLGSLGSEVLRFGAADSAGFETPRTLIAAGDIRLSGSLRIASGTRLVAGGSIVVEDEVRGDGLLLYAVKGVRIKDRARLTAQVFAEEDIELSGRATLAYPSLLYLYGRLAGRERSGELRLADRAMLDGIAILPPAAAGVDRGRIVVKSGATVRGLIWSANQTLIEGAVLGTVATTRFYRYASPTDYVNWLIDARIDVRARPDAFHLPIGFEHASIPEVVTLRSRPFW